MPYALPETLIATGVTHIRIPEVGAPKPKPGDFGITPATPELDEPVYEIYAGKAHGWQPLMVVLSRRYAVKHNGLLTHPVASLPTHYLMCAIFATLSGRTIYYEDPMDTYVLGKIPVTLEKKMAGTFGLILEIGLRKQRAVVE